MILVEFLQLIGKWTHRVEAVAECKNRVFLQRRTGHSHRTQAGPTPDTLAVVDPMSPQLSAAGGQHYGCGTGWLIEQRRCPTVDFLAWRLPAHPAAAPVKRGDVRVQRLVDHQDNVVACKNRTGRMSHGVRKGAKRHLPPNVAFRVIGDQAVVHEERINVLPIRYRRDGCGMIRSFSGLRARPLHPPLPLEVSPSRGRSTA